MDPNQPHSQSPDNADPSAASGERHFPFAAEEEPIFTAPDIVVTKVLPATDRSDEQQQFSISMLLVTMTGCAVLFAVGARLSPGAFAFWMGVATLIVLFVGSLSHSTSLTMKAISWVFLGTYLVALCRAFIEQ